MDYIKILESAIEASNNRDATLKAAEKKIKKLSKNALQRKRLGVTIIE